MPEMRLWLIVAVVLALGGVSATVVKAPDSACVESNSVIELEYNAVGSCVVTRSSPTVLIINQPPSLKYGDCQISFSAAGPRYLMFILNSHQLRPGQTLKTRTAGGTEKVYTSWDLHFPFSRVPTASSSITFSAGSGIDKTQGSWKMMIILQSRFQYTCTLAEDQYYDGLSRSSYNGDFYSQTWITAPIGCQLRYSVTNLKVGRFDGWNTPCASDYLVFDTKGEPDYSPANSQQMCGTTISAAGISNKNKLNVALFGKEGSSTGFTVRVTVVNCITAG